MAIAPRSSFCLGIISDEAECFRYDTHFHDIIQRLHSRVDLHDVTLIVGQSGKRIDAHRLILIGCSDYFSDLLADAQQREVTLAEVDEDAFEKLINFVYNGSVELQGETIEALLTTANHLRLEKVVEGCCEFIQRHLKPTNGLAAMFLAEQLNLDSLLSNARKVIWDNFEEISNQAEFLLLSAKQLSEIIAADDLRVPSEAFVFEVVMKWIEFEPETRRQNFTELLAQVRLPLLPPDYLSEKVEPLCTTMESKDLILKALKSHLLPTSNSTQPRNNA